MLPYPHSCVVCDLPSRKALTLVCGFARTILEILVFSCRHCSQPQTQCQIVHGFVRRPKSAETEAFFRLPTSNVRLWPRLCFVRTVAMMNVMLVGECLHVLWDRESSVQEFRYISQSCSSRLNKRRLSRPSQPAISIAVAITMAGTCKW